MPLITIGITCYNAQSSIIRAITSALEQNWGNKEIIVVDDQSKDESWSILENMARENTSLKIYRNARNTGPAGSRNEILKRASGSYIAFFDDDDESLPQRLSTQYERLCAYPEPLAACYASGERRYPNGYTLPLQAIGSRPPIPYGPGMAQRILYYGGPENWFVGSGTPACSLMASKATFEQIGGFDESMRRCEDMDFAVRLALAGGHFIGCPENLFIQYATEADDKSFEKNRDAEIYLARKHAYFLKDNDMGFYAQQWPRVRYHHFKRHYGRMLASLLPLLIRYPRKTITHLYATGPKRLRHERRMKNA